VVSQRSQRLRGQASAEFAMAAVVFFAIFFGIFEVGRYVYGVNAVTSGAREGARWAAAANNAPAGQTDACDATLAGLQSAVRANAQGVGPITISSTRDAATQSQWCQVTVVYSYAPAGGAFGLPAFNITSSSRQYYN
jgi:Flp pilus assembly protein TadG